MIQKEFSSTYWHWIGPVKHWLLVSPLVYVVFGICRCFLFAVCSSDKAVKVVALWYLDYIHLTAYINVGIGRGKVMPKDISQHLKWWSNHFVNLQRWILEVQALSQYLSSLCSRGSVLLSALIALSCYVRVSNYQAGYVCMNVVSLADVKSMILFYLFLDFYHWFFSLYLASIYSPLIVVSFVLLLLANWLVFALDLNGALAWTWWIWRVKIFWEKRPKLPLYFFLWVKITI